jgi:hypothetical protein
LSLKGEFTNALRDIGCFHSAAAFLAQRITPVTHIRHAVKQRFQLVSK